MTPLSLEVERNRLDGSTIRKGVTHLTVDDWQPPSPDMIRVPADKWPLFSERLDKLNKRAKALGLPPANIHVVETLRVRVERLGTVGGIPYKFRAQVPFMVLRVDGSAPCVKGWTAIAKLEPTPHGNIVSEFGGQAVPEQFRSGGIACDHCKKRRYRKAVWLLRSQASGEMKRVGGECLQDFTREEDLELALAVAKLANDLLLAGFDQPELGSSDGDDYDVARGPGPGDYVGMVEAMTIAAAMIRKHGFVSRAQAEATLDAPPTSSSVMEFVRKRNPLHGFVEPQDVETADAALNWVLSFESKTVRSTYEHNLLMVILNADSSSYGMLTAAVASYIRERDKQNAEAAIATNGPTVESKPFGEAGKRYRDMRATVLHVGDPRPGDYGSTTRVDLVLGTGEYLTWYRSGCKPLVSVPGSDVGLGTDLLELAPGDKVKATFTVKAHKQAKYVGSIAMGTVVTRAVVEFDGTPTRHKPKRFGAWDKKLCRIVQTYDTEAEARRETAYLPSPFADFDGAANRELDDTLEPRVWSPANCRWMQLP